MPRGDGTGPGGMGPGTGRGRGWCRSFIFPGNRLSTKRAGLLSLLVPVVGAVIKDAANPDGLLRSFSRKLLSNKKPDKKSNAIKADYKIIKEENVEDGK